MVFAENVEIGGLIVLTGTREATGTPSVSTSGMTTGVMRRGAVMCVEVAGKTCSHCADKG